jgi:hypothetical protein
VVIASGTDRGVPGSLVGRRFRLSGFLRSRPVLLFAFAFAVMGDPVSSVAYAIEAALRALNGHLELLLPTMALVVAIIALVDVNYHQLVGRFPEGGGAAAAAGGAFGEAWAFLPMGALIVDYVLTISISVAAGASAIIAFLPAIAGGRDVLALLLLLAVAAPTWFGHGGRTAFGLMTVAFVAVASAVLVGGAFRGHPLLPAHVTALTHPAPLAVMLAFPVAMALATGTEAPSSAIAQLGQLDDAGRRRFGRITLWLTLGIVGSLTLGITALAVRLGVGIPPPDSTQIAELARTAVATPIFAAFQATTSLLLLAAASSSFQAGPGLLRALARRRLASGQVVGVLAGWLGTTNRHHTPYWGVVFYAVMSAVVVLAAGARDQVLVLYYAVAVFLAFLAGLAAMARFSLADRSWSLLIVNLAGAVAVTFTLGVNLSRIYPLASLVAAVGIGASLYALWVRAGRPRGIAGALADVATLPEPASLDRSDSDPLT